MDKHGEHTCGAHHGKGPAEHACGADHKSAAGEHRCGAHHHAQPAATPAHSCCHHAATAPLAPPKAAAPGTIAGRPGRDRYADRRIGPGGLRRRRPTDRNPHGGRRADLPDRGGPHRRTAHQGPQLPGRQVGRQLHRRRREVPRRRGDVQAVRLLRERGRRPGAPRAPTPSRRPPPACRRTRLASGRSPTAST